MVFKRMKEGKKTKKRKKRKKKRKIFEWMKTKGRVKGGTREIVVVVVVVA